MDLDRITHPLRLASGSHQAGSGKGCAMNAISYITGDAEITDYPECCARPLATIVQWCNDQLAGPDGYLSPEDSVLALDLGWQTVRTADVGSPVVHAWVAELLTSSAWGVVWNAKDAAAEAISDIADLHRRAAAGDMPPVSVWYAADCAGQAATRGLSRTSQRSGRCAVRAAHQSIALVGAVTSAKMDAVVGNALRSHELAPWGFCPTRAVELTRHAIASWRVLAGLEICGEANPVLADRDVSPADIFA
ncbi:MAG TPA: hypothetical protein VMS16_02700 [Mycobacterium sp.]|jgi:hypothetical protein|nr:hypothetical protein [Mycobacterium sp.]